MKKPLSFFLPLMLILSIASCSLPPVTPQATPSDENPPTSTAPVTATAAPSTVTPAAGSIVITTNNAPRLEVIARAPASNVGGLAWSPDSRSLSMVTQNSSGNEQVFSTSLLNIPDLTPKGVWAAPAGTQRMVAAPDGRSVAVLSADLQTVKLVDLSSGQAFRTIQPGFSVSMVTFSPDAKYLAVTAQEEWKVIVVEVGSGAVVNTYAGFQTAAPVFDAGFAGNGDWIVWHARATIQLQNVSSGALETEMSHEDFVSTFSLSPDGKLLASASARTVNGNLSPVVILWDSATSTESRVLILTEPANALSFSPDGSMLAIALGGNIQLWDVVGGVLRITLPGSSDFIYHVEFSPDGRYLVSSAQDNQITLWGVPGQ